MTFMFILLGLVVLTVLVVIHEFGHYIVARRNGVEVEEFGVGFPPRVWGRKYGKTIYSLNLIPLGGFVRLKGESDEATSKGSFGVATYWVKSKVLLAGVAMNALAVFVILLVLSLTGLPPLFENQYTIISNEIKSEPTILVAQAIENSPAAELGLKTGDQIVKVGGTNIVSEEGLKQATESRAGQETLVTIQRDGEIVDYTTKLKPEAGDTGYLGVAPVDATTTRYTWAAPVVALGLTAQLLWLTLVALIGIIVGLLSGGGGAAAAGAVGPVGLFFILANITEFGLSYFWLLVATISASLAVFNTIPFPALDGGRLALISLFKLLKKPLTERLEGAINTVGFLLLLALAVVITVFDTTRFL